VLRFQVTPTELCVGVVTAVPFLMDIKFDKAADFRGNSDSHPSQIRDFYEITAKLRQDDRLENPMFKIRIPALYLLAGLE
jgi:hypothetical protein